MNFGFKFLMALVIGACLSINAFAAPNVTPYQPSGWSDKIVVTRTYGGVTDSTNLLTTDTLYTDWSVINSGSSTVTVTFQIYLYVDGTFAYSQSVSPPFGVNAYTEITGYSLNSLTAGTHTVKIVADATGAISGDNESDNSYTKTITVNAVVLAAPTPVTPTNGTTGLPTVPNFNWASVTNAIGYRILIATNAADLPTSSTATNGGASVVIDAVAPSTNFTPTIQLNANTIYYWEIHAVGSSENGTWSAIQRFATGPVRNGVTIIPSFDSSITGDAQAATIEATINAAIAVYRNSFTDTVTNHFTFVEMSDGLGDNSTYYTDVSYSSYRAVLVSHSTSADDATALAHLPAGASNPVNGNSQVALQYPLARALGFSTGTVSQDSTVYVNTSIMNLSSFATDPTKYSLFATVSHEMDEALGFGSVLNGLANGSAAPTGPVYPEDLFRYDQNGNRSLNTASNSLAYFSLDGTNNLAQFNQYDGGDFGDWYSYYGGNIPQVQDAFLVNGANPVLNVELRGLDVIGYTRAAYVQTNGPAKLTGATAMGGNLIFNLTGSVGATYIIQGSTNLTTWVSLSTNFIPGSGSLAITNAIGTNPRRFYRAWQQ